MGFAPASVSPSGSGATSAAALRSSPASAPSVAPHSASVPAPPSSPHRGESPSSPFELSTSELDALEDLSDEIASLAAEISSATHRQLTLIAEFDRRRGRELSGHITCAHWLAWRTGIDLGSAREKVRAARALTALPQISSALQQGDLSFSKVRALTRVADADNEIDLLEIALTSTAHQLERVVRGWKRHNRVDEQERERLRHQSRSLSVFPDEDGMYVVKGRLDPEVGALLQRALEAASQALFWKGPEVEGSDELKPEQRRADAIGLLAERALAAGLDQEGGGPDAPVSAARAERYQVVLHVEADTLAADAEPGMSELEDGTRVAAATSRRLSCDASLVRIARNANGRVLDVGRKTRTIPPAIRRALEARDRGCRFPGCGRRFTDAHHIQHWADGGHTALHNLILTCRQHHRMLHEVGYRVELTSDGRATFYGPTGRVLPNVPPLKRRTRKEVALVVERLGIRSVASEPWERPGIRSVASELWERPAETP
ncbi:MAG: DUF222 domain-containing protein [Gemmatimonadota bacterium]